MGNALIIFTPRSGSTIAAELLAYKYKSINLDELVTGQLRGVIRDRLPPDVKELVLQSEILNEDIKIPDDNLSNTYKLFHKRFDTIKQIQKKHPVVLKYFPTFSTPGVGIIEWATLNNFEIYFVTRRSAEEQLYSYLLANSKESFYKSAKRAGRLKIYEYAGFLNVKNAPRVVFPPVTITEERALNLILTLCGINNTWTAYYNKFKDYGKVVYYEDGIVRGDFSEFGINSELYKDYSLEPKSLQPTYEYSIGDQISNWNDMLEIFKQYNTA